MDDWVTVQFLQMGEDAALEFGFRRDADVTEHRSCYFGEETLYQIEPRTVLRGKDEREAALGPCGKPGLCFLGHVCGMVIQDQLDCDVRRIGAIDLFEKANELP